MTEAYPPASAPHKLFPFGPLDTCIKQNEDHVRLRAQLMLAEFDFDDPTLLEDDDMSTYIERAAQVFAPDGEQHSDLGFALACSVAFAYDTVRTVIPKTDKWVLLHGVPDYFEAPEAADFAFGQIQRYLADRPHVAAYIDEFADDICEEEDLSQIRRATAFHFMAMDAQLHHEYIEAQVKQFRGFLEVADLAHPNPDV